jgi:hypothetical protein
MMRLIDFFSEEIIDRSICLSRLFIFSGSTLNSRNDQIALDAFLGVSQVF